MLRLYYMLKDKIRETIAKFNMINNGDSVIVAVSGGPDSMTLLSVLIDLKEEYNLKLYAAHVNHGIRENAQIDENYVKDFCNKNGIECFIKVADVVKMANEEKRGLEEVGRKVRYSFFEEVMKNTGANKVAIAHNLNDKAETVIMNILRGSGVSGLRGIEPKRGVYIRPLIEVQREEIERYCEEKELNPRHDESNDDNSYTRNRIRNIVIPYLKKEFNPNIVEVLNRLAEIVKEEENYMEKQTAQAFEEVLETQCDEKIEYNVRKFNAKEAIIQKKLILLGINKTVGTIQGIEKINLEDIIKLCNNNIGNKYLTPNKSVRIGIENKRIYIMKQN